MEVKFSMLTPVKSEELKRRLLKMPLFLYETSDWSAWWSRNSQRPRTVLKHQHYAFAERAENVTARSFGNRPGAVREMENEFKKRVESVHKMSYVDIKIDPVSFIGGKLVYKGVGKDAICGQSGLPLSGIQKAVEAYESAGICEIFDPNSEASHLRFMIDRDLRIGDVLADRDELGRYAGVFVRELRYNGVPFYATWSPDYVLSYVIAANKQDGGYSVDLSAVPVFNKALRSAFRQ